MKSAPNLKKQPYDKMTEVIIFAGSDAWAHAKQWQEQDGRLAGDNNSGRNRTGDWLAI
ncbi:hypothetical protein, partial [Escherichia coli]|uniref:hypothetical protein n=1 Tax=Escherichia coli TaxID=562 RepID=UPI0019026FF8